MSLSFHSNERFAIGTEGCDDAITRESARAVRHHNARCERRVVVVPVEHAFLRFESHRRFGWMHRRHRGVEFFVEMKLFRLHIEIERAGISVPAIDLELNRNVIGEAIAIEMNLGGGHLHVVAGQDLHAAFSVRFFRLAVELCSRTSQFVRQAGRPINRELHVLESVPA